MNGRSTQKSQTQPNKKPKPKTKTPAPDFRPALPRQSTPAVPLLALYASCPDTLTETEFQKREMVVSKEKKKEEKRKKRVGDFYSLPSQPNQSRPDFPSMREI
jgi:hypothetical protein